MFNRTREKDKLVLRIVDSNNTQIKVKCTEIQDNFEDEQHSHTIISIKLKIDSAVSEASVRNALDSAVTAMFDETLG